MTGLGFDKSQNFMPGGLGFVWEIWFQIFPSLLETKTKWPVVVVILAEDRSIQEKLLYYDLKVQTISQVAPIQLYAASVLSSLFAHLGQSFHV